MGFRLCYVPAFLHRSNRFLKYAAKLERYFQKVGIVQSANPCQIDANPCHLLKKWGIPSSL
jgi:hypothetical protein